MVPKSHLSVRPFDIIVVGEINPDLIVQSAGEPEYGQVEKLVDDIRLTIGSSGVIFACGCARLGLRVAYCGKVGADEFGRFMLAAMQEKGIHTGGVIIDPAVRTGISIILSKGSDRAILTYPGAIPALHLADIDPGVLAQARHLHLTGYYIQEGLKPDVPKIFKMAKEAGLSVSLDTNYDPAQHWDGVLPALEYCDVFLPNATECRAIAGTDNLDDAVRVLSGHVTTLAVKLGAGGALGRQSGQQVNVPAIPVEVVDTVGAGDTFDAGFLYGYLAGWSLERCLKLGIAAGSLSTRQAGGTAGQPGMDDILAIL